MQSCIIIIFVYKRNIILMKLQKRLQRIPLFGIFLLVASIVIVLTIVAYSPLDNEIVYFNKLGVFGHKIGSSLLISFGYAAWLVPSFLFIMGTYFIICSSPKMKLAWRHIGGVFAFLALLVAVSIFIARLTINPSFLSGGILGAWFRQGNWVASTAFALVLVLFAFLGFYKFFRLDFYYLKALFTQNVEILSQSNNIDEEKSELEQKDVNEVSDYDPFATYKPYYLFEDSVNEEVSEFQKQLDLVSKKKNTESFYLDKTKKENYLLDKEEEPKALESEKDIDNNGEQVDFLQVSNQENNFVIASEKEKIDKTDEFESNPKLQADENHQKNAKIDQNPFVHPLLPQNKKLEKPTTPLPTLSLLSKPSDSVCQVDEDFLYKTSQTIEQVLRDFGVKAEVKEVLIGAVVTRYEIELEPGVKSSKVMGLSNDISRALSAKVRITEVVPSKPYMGIETPNSDRQTVWLYDLIKSKEFQNSKAKLPLILGQDIAGDPVIIDLIDTPHLLVAGQTKAGKSVGLNAMIISLLYKLSPKELRMIMVDPKAVELEVYNHIPHLITPVIDGVKEATNALKWAVAEMERRYQLLKHLGVRNMESYNEIIEKSYEMNYPIPDPTWTGTSDMNQKAPHLEKMHYLVLIIDEFGDLMAAGGAKEIEQYIVRIAQKARAAGIHLILATQRPSADVITGLIKANLPSRIAFTVASGIDSRTILDRMGAENLLGRGDMLYSGAGAEDLLRVHGAFMSDDDVVNVANDWRARERVKYIDGITNIDESEIAGDIAEDDLDPLFNEAHKFMSESKRVSISSLQTRFAIGFPRAAKIVNQLENKGIVSPQNGGKRELLIEFDG